MTQVSVFDKFGVEEMSGEERTSRHNYIVGKCLCPGCPTYVEGDSPVGYCFPVVGTSRNIQWEKECLCETCPVDKEYELNHTFYCTRCSQLCQTYKTEVGGMHE